MNFLEVLKKVQRSLYFITAHGTEKIWSYIAGGLEIKVINTENCPLGPNHASL